MLGFVMGFRASSTVLLKNLSYQFATITMEDGGAARVLTVHDFSKTEVGLLQSKELNQYILETNVYPREPEPLKELRNATASQPRNVMLTAPDGGALMALLLRLMNAKKTIEVGVYTGYSLLLTALSIPDDGKIVAIDIDREAYGVGLPIIQKAGVEHKIDFIESNAILALDKLLEDPKNEGSFDYAFVDADKANYLNYYERLMKLVRIGGLIVFDNTLWSGTVAWASDSLLDDHMKLQRHHVLKINKFLAADTRIQLSQVPTMEDGAARLTVRDLSKTDMGLLQSKELNQYILETNVYPREPEPLKELRNATASHPRKHMLTAPDGGALMALLLRLMNAKKTIEIGVYTGYSLLLTALSIPDDGKIVAIDMDREAFMVGLPIIQKAGVEHKIDFIESEAIPILDKLLEDPKKEGSFDYAFVDADKDNYVNYHERLMKLVRIGGLIVFDNTLWAGTVAWASDSLLDDYMQFRRHHVLKINKFLAEDTRIQLSQVPVGDGLTICRRLY
ncbi:hypothetical protein HHK36_006029 [Tetracentron sinense]|uniref:Caffeoyl-CoA O-methyltransferase n=1 Tax=Tetracentron sinense TaxID=13715 RepID=A0A835DJU5_TETSI|nr:hypothetical protein HHK36_006029 [Tetracentron sinense]